MSRDTKDIKVGGYYWYKDSSVPDAKWKIVRVRKDSAGSGFHVDFIDKKTFETVTTARLDEVPGDWSEPLHPPQ